MKGKHHIIVQNNRLHYEFDILRNITIIQGDSARGKTTLIDMIRTYQTLGDDSGILVHCDCPLGVLEGRGWAAVLPTLHDQILFIDEENTFIKTQEFADAVQHSDCWFVLVTRENLPNLPYSVNEIYGIHSSGKYHDLKRTYNELYHIYSYGSVDSSVEIQPEIIVTEDSGAGYGFFRAICSESNCDCRSSQGKSNLISALSALASGKILIIGDGAAIGPEMNDLYHYMALHPDVHCYLPESFEWIILKSGLIDGSETREILSAPEDYIDSSRYFSWERYFTALLVRQSNGTYLQYNKAEINPNYLHEREKNTILKVMHPIRFH